jgi:hypothetical protein
VREEKIKTKKKQKNGQTWIYLFQNCHFWYMVIALDPHWRAQKLCTLFELIIGPRKLNHEVPTMEKCHLPWPGFMVHGVNPPLLRWSLECSVKWPWAGSAFSTNESAWSAVVTGPQARVWQWHYRSNHFHTYYCFLLLLLGACAHQVGHPSFALCSSPHSSEVGPPYVVGPLASGPSSQPH